MLILDGNLIFHRQGERERASGFKHPPINKLLSSQSGFEAGGCPPRTVSLPPADGDAQLS